MKTESKIITQKKPQKKQTTPHIKQIVPYIIYFISCDRSFQFSFNKQQSFNNKVCICANFDKIQSFICATRLYFICAKN